MKALILGANGQVGWELQRALAPIANCVALGRSASADGFCGELSNLDALRQTLRNTAPDVIINAAAYTNVDGAETDREAARQINALGPAALAEEAGRSGGLLIHYSTDYIFNGRGDRPWLETDDPEPTNYYGETKLAGEEAIRASGCRHLIFRTQWIHAPRRTNFVTKILEKCMQLEELSIVDDQIGAPTSAELIADLTAHAALQIWQGKAACGVYNLSAAGTASWFEFGAFIVELARSLDLPVTVKPGRIIPVSSAAIDWVAKRPLNSRLDTARIRSTFGVTLPNWRVGARRTVYELAQVKREGRQATCVKE